MSLKPDDLAQIILDSIDDDEPPTALYTLNIHEARMLAHAVLNVVQAAARVGRVSDEAEIAASEAYAQGVGERPFSQRMRAAITAALPHLTADDLRGTPAGQALMAETWSKFQEHYATEWEEAYPEDVFPSPAPAPAVVSRESVAASMMRQWAKNLRADHNPFEEGDA